VTGQGRQLQLCNRATLLRRMYGKLTLMGFDHRLDHRKTKAGAVGLGGVESLGNTPGLIGMKTGAIVDNPNGQSS